MKAFVRRGTARRALGRPLDSAEDFEAALRLEPGNKTFLAERLASLAALEAETGLSLAHPQVEVAIQEVAAAPAAGEAGAASTSSAASEPRALPVVAPPAPRTSTEFETGYRSLAQDGRARQQFLASLNAAEVPKIFNEQMAPQLLSSVTQDVLESLLLLGGEESPLPPTHALALLAAFSQLPRFAVVVMCWNKKEKAVIRALWESAAAAALDTENSACLRGLQAVYIGSEKNG